MREAGLKDSAAICRYLAWLEATVKLEKGRRAKALALGSEEPLDDGPGGEQAWLTEWTASQALGKFREREEGMVGESFPTISSSGPNAAIGHPCTLISDYYHICYN